MGVWFSCMEAGFGVRSVYSCIQTILGSLDPENETTLFLQNIGKYPTTHHHIPEDLVFNNATVRT
jgi:hypothetical protein